MIAVIYRFMLKPHQEDIYKKYWHELASYFIAHRGALGSCLHKSSDGLWVAYSRWPDKATRDASWPKEAIISQELPHSIADLIRKMQAIQQENTDLHSYDEICLEVIDDLLL